MKKTPAFIERYRQGIVSLTLAQKAKYFKVELTTKPTEKERSSNTVD